MFDKQDDEDNIPVGLMMWCSDCGASYQFIELDESEFDLDNLESAVKHVRDSARCGDCHGGNMLEHDVDVDSELSYLQDEDTDK
jgi:hypothetical protein